MRFFLLLAIIAAVSAFVPRSVLRNPVAPLKESTYWEGKAPSSKVLGVGEKIPSAVFGPFSLVALIVGTYCVHESNILHSLTVDTLNPQYILGSLLVPISWGAHVAAWIQKENGK